MPAPLRKRSAPVPSDVDCYGVKPTTLSQSKSSVHNDHWYLLQLKPGGFERAKLNLARQGFVSFMPLTEVTCTSSGRFSTSIQPLFAGYLFVRVPPGQTHWRAINSTYGVARLVALHDAIPTGVPATLIAALRTRCDVESKFIPSVNLEPGSEVRLTAGPFAEQIATIEAVPDATRVWVLMQMMGQTVRTTVTATTLRPA